MLPVCRYYTLLAWLPSFFELALGLSVQSSSLLTLIPYIAMVLMTPFVGPVADGLVKRGWSLTNVRKLAQVCMHAIQEMRMSGFFMFHSSLTGLHQLRESLLSKHLYAALR